jgi:hypothetical protein
MKITDQEERCPSPDIVADPMDKHKGRSKTVFPFPGDRVHHTSGVSDGIKSEGPRHLFLH